MHTYESQREKDGQRIEGRIKSAFLKRMGTLSKKTQRTMYANDFSVLNPIIWANEAILQLQPNMILGNLVNRDFDPLVARFGDTVNAFVPGTFVMTRKGSLCENVTVQDASGSAIQVPLNQWPQVSFLICDGEENRNQLDLIETLLVPAVIALARGIDQILAQQVYSFMTDLNGLDNSGGQLGTMTSSNIKSFMTQTRQNMNQHNVPLPGRVLVMSPATESTALELPDFTLAYAVGDKGESQNQAILGEKLGFNIFMTQTQPDVASGGQTTLAVAINNSAGYAPGTTTVTVNGANAAATLAGQWCVIAGDGIPQYITARTNTSLTITPGLKNAVVNTATVTIISGATINAAGGYIGTSLVPQQQRTIGWAKEIIITGSDNSIPQLGQLVTFGTDPTTYSIIGLRVIAVNTGDFGITLDKPLVNAVANGATVNFGPAGAYNFAFLRNALSLVNRPLPQPRAGTGVLARVVSDPVNKISLRVTISYDAELQGHLVTVDTLIGVGILSHNLGSVMYG